MALVQLKVKIKSLAAESAIIRKEENKRRQVKGAPPRSPEVVEDRASLKEHRRGVVREESRCSLLAYGYLRGRPYRLIEATCHQQPQWDKVESIVKRFKPAGANDIDLKIWCNE